MSPAKLIPQASLLLKAFLILGVPQCARFTAEPHLQHVALRNLTLCLTVAFCTCKAGFDETFMGVKLLRWWLLRGVQVCVAHSPAQTSF